jgi:hypothetical protein
MINLASYFEELRSAIEPDAKYQKHAQKADDPVREHLRTHSSFSSRHVNTFLYGSYPRDTAIGNIKDVDIVVVTNYTTYASPVDVLNKLKDSLGYLYRGPDLADQRRSIRVDRPLPEIPDASLTLDVIPAINQGGPEDPLWVPDRDKREWILSHPRGHMAHTSLLNSKSYLGRYFVPTVKMMKWWWKRQFELKRPGMESHRRKPKGFWIETMTGQYADLSKQSYPELIASVYANAFDAFKVFRTSGRVPDLRDPGLAGGIVKTSITAEEFTFFLNTLEESLNIAREALGTSSEARAQELWQKLFGTKAEVSASLKGGGSLLKPAAAPGALRFPDRPLAPRDPGGFAG